MAFVDDLIILDDKSENVPLILDDVNTFFRKRGICRHNDVCKLISDYCVRKNVTFCEPHIRRPDGTLFKPDLVVQLNDILSFVVDIQILWEGQS